MLYTEGAEEVEWLGGVPYDKLVDAAPLEVVKATVEDLLEGAYVTGHGVEGALVCLDISIDRKHNKDITLYPIGSMPAGRRRGQQPIPLKVCWISGGIIHSTATICLSIK